MNSTAGDVFDIGEAKTTADQPKNHRRIIAHVAAIGATKASASRFNVSPLYRLRRERFKTGTSMSRKLSHEDDTRTGDHCGPGVGRGWMVRVMRRRSEDTPTQPSRDGLFYTLLELLPALTQELNVPRRTTKHRRMPGWAVPVR